MAFIPFEQSHGCTIYEGLQYYFEPNLTSALIDSYFYIFFHTLAFFSHPLGFQAKWSDSK